MYRSEKSKIAREFCTEILISTFKSFKNFNQSKTPQITEYCKKVEDALHQKIISNKEYSEGIIKLINQILEKLTEKTEKEKKSIFTTIVKIKLLIIIYDSDIKYKIKNSNNSEEIQKITEYYQNKLDYFKSASNLLETIAPLQAPSLCPENQLIFNIIDPTEKLITKLLVESINDIDVILPLTLKEQASKKILSNSFVFATVTKLIKENIISPDMAEEIFKDSKNVPDTLNSLNSLKESIDLKRKEYLEKESITNEM